MIEKVLIESTIPTVQYGNVRTAFTGIIGKGETVESVRNEILVETKKISDMVAGEGYTFDVRGLPVAKTSTTQPATTVLSTKTSELTGVSVSYDDAAHVYTNKDGAKYLSGSKFPEPFYAPFDSQMIIKKLVEKYPGINGLEIAEMWKRNGEASTNLGSSVHAALENFDKHRSLGATMGGEEANKALSKNFIIRKIVESFQETRPVNEDVLSECFVANEEYNLCGMIDRLLFVDRAKKIVRIQDYKTDGNIQDKKYQVKDSPFKGAVPNTLLGYHLLQLSFYAFILTEAGYTVEGLDIFWLNTEKLVTGVNPWETFQHDVVDIAPVIKKK